MRIVMGRGLVALAAGTMLAGCVGGVTPPPSTSTGVPVHPAPSTSTPPPSAGTPAAGYAVPSGRAFNGSIVGATPLAGVPSVVTSGAAMASGAGVTAGPDLSTLLVDERQAEAARAAFRQSCPGLMRRTDASGLTRGADWSAACSAAASVGRNGARDFFARYFEAVQVGDGRAFATGYYEPEIAASPDRRSGYEVPIYGRPSDLIDVDLGQFSDSLKGRKIRGRVQGSKFVPYYDRTAIETGAITATAPVLAWGADPAAVFFLQVQGSGRLRLPGGDFIRVGYDTQNGRDYTGIGALMKARGLLGPGQTSMQGIVAWIHAHPTEGEAIMRENRSFVFFRRLDTPPVGAMGYVVSGGVSAAADPKFVPLGAPFFLSADRRDATGLWVAQDTGGAIKGANRFDTYWGAGPEATATAGGMAARGTAFLLLPRGTLTRLTGGRSVAPYSYSPAGPAATIPPAPRPLLAPPNVDPRDDEPSAQP
ncbi:membrane-bound lytic murein transglycosylase A [Sphingomonas gellani]|uniref:peptidoglycan lytic exotransglycosylase n=1 Tax=Sphingomonas gellani TaxID=1166340 RepID=A0A1H7Y093_9SPHN|nr:murein transglycosylase A [Sphingomonas gellani]SEM39602.1 membrane-bound lytic murein transglycosylase A [Sphingomonas gellani]